MIRSLNILSSPPVAALRSAAGGVAELARDVIVPQAPNLAEVRSQALSNTQLTGELVQLLDAPLRELGFVLDPKFRRIRDNRGKALYHHRVGVTGGYIALLYVGYRLLESATFSQDILWILWPFPNNGAVGVTVFSDAQSIEGVYHTFASQFVEMKSLKVARFVSRLDLEDLEYEDNDGKKRLLGEWMGLDKFVPGATRGSSTPQDLKKDAGKVKKITDILFTLANNAPQTTVGPRGYIALLIRKTNWPENVKARRASGLTGDPEFDARGLVDYALDQETNPEHQRYTFIGSLLEVLLEEGLDKEDQDFLKGTIAAYNLIENRSP